MSRDVKYIGMDVHKEAASSATAAMKPSSRHDECIALRLVEDRQQVCSTGKQRRSCVVDSVEEVDGCYHQRV